MDGVNEAETRVVVRVRDVNDLPPTFLQNSYQTVIFEESLHRFSPIITVSWILSHLNIADIDDCS